jgi:nucleoside-diphosphate-sugar epimerase/predicted dehydrogenase
MKILLLASSSFAATGLPQRLQSAGHDVWTFNRALPSQHTPNDLAGSYDQLGEIASREMGQAEVLINYAIVKNGSIEQNIAQLDLIMKAARSLGVKRFIHISSISVLPSINGTLNEDAAAVDAQWKGVYSRIKAAVEQHVIHSWKSGHLDIVRPGFILAPGVVDSMVGTGKALPTGHVLGLGNRKTVIMLIHRDTVNEALTKLVELPLPEVVTMKKWMLVAPNAPERTEYLDFQCHELGRGWQTLHLPVWFWRVALACASPLLSILKRQPYRLVKLFEHNLNVRHYDCTRTSTELGLEMNFDWRQCLRDLVHLKPSPFWPEGGDSNLSNATNKLGYVGMGRIVTQKHLPGLKRNGFTGRICWTDPVVKKMDSVPGLALAEHDHLDADVSHVVVTAPWVARGKILENLPTSAQFVLFEKPLAVSQEHLTEMIGKLGTRHGSVLHNYRFKPNVLKYRKFLRQHPTGSLRAVTLHFETPSPANEQSAWMKQERKHRIVLCDYALHFLDLAWIFCIGKMQTHRCDVDFNDRGELERVSAALSFDGVPCDVLIRSGCHQRQCIVTHHFQNYSAELRFFPDVFVPITGGKGLLDDAQLAASGLVSTGAKILEKLGAHTSDLSHDKVLEAFSSSKSAIMSELSVEALREFYERLTTLADRVYGVAD